MNDLKYKEDLSSGVVVFLVALPLCLGIALASGAPFFSGMIAGIVGGIIIGLLSNSNVSVSGPAAGLAAIVYTSIATLGGSFESFLLAVVFAGLLQIAFGFFGWGSLSKVFPIAVIKGLLCAIGILIILKQIPHFLGILPTSDFKFSTFHLEMQKGALVIGTTSLLILLLWDKPFFRKFKSIPAGLLVVLTGIVFNEFFNKSFPPLSLHDSTLVQVPVAETFSDFKGFFKFPDFSQWKNSEIYIIAVTLAVIASIETLLCIEATDKLDPLKRTTSTNRELKAQGIGNLISGLIGGIPITSVIVRSSANINAGAKTKASAIIHGALLLLSVMFIPHFLNKIPLSCLASILLVTGYKLSSPTLFKEMFNKGIKEFAPFLITIIAIVGLDLLKGVIIGFIIYSIINYKLLILKYHNRSASNL